MEGRFLQRLAGQKIGYVSAVGWVFFGRCSRAARSTVFETCKEPTCSDLACVFKFDPCLRRYGLSKVPQQDKKSSKDVKEALTGGDDEDDLIAQEERRVKSMMKKMSSVGGAGSAISSSVTEELAGMQSDEIKRLVRLRNLRQHPARLHTHTSSRTEVYHDIKHHALPLPARAVW